MDGPEHDRLLIERLAAGDAAALEALYDRHAGLVFAVVVRVVGERRLAEEILQEVFLRVWQHVGTYDGSLGSLRSWLLAIAHNLALNELRRQRRRPREGGVEEIEWMAHPAPGPAEEAWAAARRTRLSLAIAHLAEAEQAVIVLYAAGHSQSEIATRLGAPLGTVKSRMRRALGHLRDILRADGFDIE